MLFCRREDVAFMNCALAKIVVTRALVAAAIGVLLALPASAQTESASAEAEAPSSVAAASAQPAASAEHGWAVQFALDAGGDYLHFCRRRTRCGSASAARGRLPSIRPTTVCRSGRRKSTVRGPAAIPTDRRRCNCPWRLRSGRWAPRREAGKWPIPGATCCVRRSASSAGRSRSRSRPSGPGRTAIRDRFRPATRPTRSRRRWCWRNTSAGRPGSRRSRLPPTPRASRVAANQHWASDVVFGASVGMASGRTVTIHLRDTRLALAPLAVPGGGGVLVTALR